MGITQELLDKAFPSLDIKAYKKKPWLKRDYKEELFIMPVDYIIQHLDGPDKMKVFGIENKKQEAKKQAVREKLKNIPKAKLQDTAFKQFPPIFLTLHKYKHEFRARDGISRLAVFKEKKIPLVHAVVLVGEW